MSWNRKKPIFTIADIPTLNESYAELASSSADPLFPVDERWSDRISLWAGDMTTLQIDAIVNAANTSLLGGGGIDGAIHNAAGNQLLQECRGLNGCETGKAKITKGYNLPAKYVIHTVGPIGEKPEALRSCYNSVLDLLRDNKLATVAFCCISTGIYGYDNGRAARVALETVRKWLDEHHEDAMKIERIIFCVFLSKDDQIYRKLIPLYFPKAEIVSRNDSEQKEKPATAVNPVNKNVEQLSLEKTESFESQAADDSTLNSMPTSTPLKVDATQGDPATQGNNAADATLSKAIRHSDNEESLEKRKAEDAIAETDTPNKRSGSSRRNSTDSESVEDATKQ